MTLTTTTTFESLQQLTQQGDMLDTHKMADTAVTLGRTDDYILVSKPKKGIAYVEARLKDDRILLSRLEQEWSPPKLKDDTVISLEADLLKEPVFHKGVPSELFHSLRVVEFQGLDPTTRVVSMRDVAIKVNLYRCTPESPSVSDDEIVTMLPSSTLDGLWELLVLDHSVQSRILRWVNNYAMSRTTQLPLASSAASSIVPLLGPTGSGKTTLTKALAQKVAIRLCATHETIRLVEAGSRQPYNFNHFARGALEDPSCLHILIIDNVEAIAWSCKRPDAEQHMIETVRITSLCLAGLDVLRAVPNALAYATCSMDTMLDDGLLDRCSITANLTLLKAPERYEMLRRRRQACANCSSIHCASWLSTVTPFSRISLSAKPKTTTLAPRFFVWRELSEMTPSPGLWPMSSPVL
ncbi:Thyroid receptor-interacting protein 13 [Colletotrichum higginsianum IMI 349063]|uniref:Thyroid receptor-interacting protein 13 n=1 Tax=Colletotrichum higginsianum (strain IMI 349063) TaxID=759273 RepID=A0A1B7XXD6_COLHI|nr:Thyroid receptor-interacting protein 13 [Colletotrichum higginsianum IMI 349063]OBR04422.1 Thyroid receptor-interacting protein 13 [Colletotrichum higginsianum IMI 349063]